MNFLCMFIDEWKMISDILNIHKSHPPRSFELLYVLLFNISKHVSVSARLFIISISCFVFFAGFLKIISPGGRRFGLFLCLGSGEFALSKNFQGVCPGGWPGLELTDILGETNLDSNFQNSLD